MAEHLKKKPKKSRYFANRSSRARPRHPGRLGSCEVRGQVPAELHCPSRWSTTVRDRCRKERVTGKPLHLYIRRVETAIAKTPVTRGAWHLSHVALEIFAAIQKNVSESRS